MEPCRLAGARRDRRAGTDQRAPLFTGLAGVRGLGWSGERSASEQAGAGSLLRYILLYVAKGGSVKEEPGTFEKGLSFRLAFGLALTC